ncbi:MAG: GWxTD domain-containing protein [Bryobacteraceae bacterium]
MGSGIRGALFTLGLLGAIGQHAYSSAAKLPPRHEEWLNGPPSLLLTKTEREAFVGLLTEEQRDRFIDRFWEIRNPRPGGPSNEFKDEFYSRVAFANAFYGRDAGSEGWRTDRGRTYILFGKPQTSMNFLSHQELYPTEMWFYSNPGLSELPPFFYVLFFEKDGVSGYRLYNPVTDGPDKLMRAGPTKAQAFNYLRGINPELAQATLTLIPGDMVDTESYSGSMASMAVLNAVRGFRDMPSYERSITERIRRYDQVTSKVTYDVPRSALQTFVAIDQGEPWVHWRLEIQDPLRPKVQDGRVSFQIRARLYSKDQLVYERNDSPGFAVPGGQQESVTRRPFVYEERFPVSPGDYRLVVTADSGAGQHYEAERPFSVGSVGGSKPFVGELLLAARFAADSRARPFQFEGMRFEPLMGGTARASEPLCVVFQATGKADAGAELIAEYVVGSISGKFRKTFEDKVDVTEAGTAGVTLVAKTLDIGELSPGSYMLALRLRNTRSGEVVGRSARFQVTAQGEERPIVVAKPPQSGPQAMAAVHYERALCWLSQQRPDEALREAEASWRLSQLPAAKQLMEVLIARAGKELQK